MVICTKCKKEISGLKGEHTAIFSFVSCAIMTPLFGLGSLFLIPFGLYFYFFHHSRNHVCGDCRSEVCPDCSNQLSRRSYCKSCQVAHCPYCTHTQTITKGVSWATAIIVFIASPLIVALFFLVSAMSLWLIPTVYLIYEGVSSPVCQQCNKRILLSNV